MSWPLEETLSVEGMEHVARALETYLGKRWPLKASVEAELQNTINVIRNAQERDALLD